VKIAAASLKAFSARGVSGPPFATQRMGHPAKANRCATQIIDVRIWIPPLKVTVGLNGHKRMS